MKRFLTFIFGFILLAAPALASAQSWQTVAQLTAVAASLEAQAAVASTGESLACAALFSASSVHLGEQVALAWGSVGALDPLSSSSSVSMWSQNGSATLSFTQVGTWTYSFTFYSAQNSSTTCAAKIVVAK